MARDKRRRQARPRRGPGPADLLSAVAQSLASGEPLDFLDYVSNLLTAVDPRGQNPFEHERSGGPEFPTLSELLESFTEIVLPETTALLAALAELGPDELTRARARRALAARPHPLPDWLARLGEASVYRAAESTHVLGDGDSVLLGVRLRGYELTAVIYIDHNLGTIVKDAFTAPGSIGEVIERMREITDDPDVRLGDISLADARVRAAEAITLGGRASRARAALSRSAGRGGRRTGLARLARRHSAAGRGVRLGRCSRRRPRPGRGGPRRLRPLLRRPVRRRVPDGVPATAGPYRSRAACPA